MSQTSLKNLSCICAMMIRLSIYSLPCWHLCCKYLGWFGILLVIQGEKGIGKTLFYSILEHILGDVNCTSISDIEQLVGRFNDKRKDKKLVCLEEIGSSVYDPKNWNKIKDMITSGKGSFDAKHKAIEDSPSFTFFMQLTNDEYCVRVDPQGVRRIFLINANNYWSKQ